VRGLIKREMEDGYLGKEWQSVIRVGEPAVRVNDELMAGICSG
jgi:hypothetical protein